MSTKAIAVKSALEAMLSATSPITMEAVQVTYGVPVRAPERRWACVHEVRWRSAEWATNRSRNEVFGVAVTFNVQLLAGNARDAEAAVLKYAAAFEDALKDNPGLGGLCITTNYEPRQLRSWPIADGYEAQLDTEVVATCRP